MSCAEFSQEIIASMSALFDLAMDTALSFKLGSHYSNPNKCVYIDHYSCTNADIDGKYIKRINQIIDYDTLPEKRSDSVRLVIISDTHNRHKVLPPLPPGDIFVHCGDIFMTSSKYSTFESMARLKKFNQWLGKDDQIPCAHKVVVGGNHDWVLEHLGEEESAAILTNCIYSVNNVFTLYGLNFYCCPLSRGASGNKAFQGESFRNESKAKAQDLASTGVKIDVLLTHGTNAALRDIIKPRYAHLFGHYHYMNGANVYPQPNTDQPLLTACCSTMDRHYQLTNVPFVVDLPSR